MTFFGEPRWAEDDVHPHESPASMTIPMVVLALGSLFGGGLLVMGGGAAELARPGCSASPGGSEHRGGPAHHLEAGADRVSRWWSSSAASVGAYARRSGASSIPIVAAGRNVGHGRRPQGPLCRCVQRERSSCGRGSWLTRGVRVLRQPRDRRRRQRNIAAGGSAAARPTAPHPDGIRALLRAVVASAAPRSMLVGLLVSSARLNLDHPCPRQRDVRPRPSQCLGVRRHRSGHPAGSRADRWRSVQFALPRTVTKLAKVVALGTTGRARHSDRDVRVQFKSHGAGLPVPHQRQRGSSEFGTCASRSARTASRWC